jgi:hypothetical protein
MVLSSGDLARMRTTAEQLMPDTCTIQTVTMTRDAFGGATKAWANTYTGVVCRLMRAVRSTPRTIEAGGAQQAVTADWVVTLHHDQAIALGDRLVFTNVTLEPLAINTDKSWEVATRVECREVATG